MCTDVNPYSPAGCWLDSCNLNDYLAAKLHVREDPRLVPHAYCVADLAYRDLLKSKHDQAVFVGGESGAGKTEACKFMMQYLLTAQRTVQQPKGGSTSKQRKQTEEARARNEVGLTATYHASLRFSLPLGV
jgi:myosin heavy subunit|eukprot:COSAG06_NODE_1103_length_10693_cov_26.276760_3_plen_131_part_00